jgi:hypothetical protein
LCRGVGHNLTATPSGIPNPFPFFFCAFTFARRSIHDPKSSVAFAFDASGVGQNPDSVAKVRCVNDGSRYAVPFRVIPDLGQVAENVSNPPSKQCCDVFHEHPSGP